MTRTDTAHAGLAATGWVVFGSMAMVLAGAFNVVEGVIVLFNDERLVVAPDRLVVFDATGLGWALLISGLVVGATGFGLMSGQGWSRITAIVVVALHAILQIAWFAAYPVWSVMMVVLDVGVLWAVTAGWSTVENQLGD